MHSEIANIPGRERFRNHVHESVHVCAVLAGGFLERRRGGAVDVAPGTVRCSAAARHDLDFAREGARCLVLELADDEREVLGRFPGSPIFLRDNWLVTLSERLDTAAQRSDAAGTLALETLAIELLAQVARRRQPRATRSPPGWLRRVRERLHELRPPPTLQELASYAGVHRVHVARAFRDHFGLPLGDYARRLRLERAYRLLLDTDWPLAQVAAELGFADQSHLTRSVRTAYGTSPARLRQQKATGIQDQRATIP
ncbi:MAG: helix-turn-helix transcriptional regulator [Gemmatimonadales bacterium]